jgi:hypothetical protein
MECARPAVNLALESRPCSMQVKKAALALLCCAALMVFAAPTARAQDQCSAPTAAPAVGTGAVGSANGTSTCGVLITLNPNGQNPSITTPGNGNPYDGTEDTLVGIQNNSGGSVSSITLSSGSPIFGFDADGPCDPVYHPNSYSWCTNPNFTGYEGPDNTFTNINTGKTSGTVNFTTPIPNGESTWFALEGTPSSLSFTVSYTLSVTELGLGAGTVSDTSAPTPINCTEAGTGLPQTGVCSETDAPGTNVTLTATPSGSSTFGGWGGACASFGTASTCTVTMNSAQNVTASFVAAPLPPFELTFIPGTNVTQSALLCYGMLEYPPTPCADPNASELTILIPTVYTQFSLTLQVTEFSDNGLCPSTGTVFTNFACRFQSFFNFGNDGHGNTIAPLSYPYVNGNSVQYLLYYGSPGGTIPPAFYSGDLYLDLGLINTSAALNLPSYWAGSAAPVVLDDPDSNEFSPPLPYGTDCSTAMLVNGVSTNPPIYCQFDANITTFYNPSASLNSTGGGKIPSNNNFGLVFLPTNVPNPGPSPIPTPVAPTIAGNCVGSNGCALNTVPVPPTITFTEGTGGTFEVSVTNAAYPPAILTELGTLPGGVTFNPVTGLISGTPADGTTGNYPITLTATNSAGAPTLSYTLTVTPAGTLTITASSPSMTYGGAVPSITASGSGFVNGDTLTSLTTQPNCSTTATSQSPVGPYTTTCSGAVDANYSMISYVPGTLTVNAAPGPVNITASSSTVTYGVTVPAITPTYSGFVNGESATPTLPTCSSSATSSKPAAGSYTTNCMGAVDANYSAIKYTSGTLTVSPAGTLTITASSPTMTYGGTVPAITPIYSGFVNGESATPTPPTCTTTATSTSLPGTYTSTCSGAVDTNYSAINYVAGTVTVVGLDISPLTVNFGNLYLDQIGVQFVTLKNTTNAPITITGMTLGGGTANGDYGSLSFCPPYILVPPSPTKPASLPAGKSCAIGVGILAIANVFSPTASTTYLTITDSAATQTVLLTALVTDPQVSLSSTNLNFGNQKTGTTSSAQKVTLTNSGLTTLTLTGLTISGNFALAPGTTCTSSTVLSPGAPCYIYVNFTPTSKGFKSGTVTIKDLTLFGTQYIWLSGTGN